MHTFDPSEIKLYKEEWKRHFENHMDWSVASIFNEIYRKMHATTGAPLRIFERLTPDGKKGLEAFYDVVKECYSREEDEPKLDAELGESVKIHDIHEGSNVLQ